MSTKAGAGNGPKLDPARSLWNSGAYVTLGLALSPMAWVMAHLLSSSGSYDSVEGVGLYHQWEWARGLLYAENSWTSPPWSVPFYGPLWYAFLGVWQISQPSLWPGRFLSSFSLFLCVLLVWRPLRREKLESLPFFVAVLGWLACLPAVQFGAVNRTDAPALALALAAVLQFLTGRTDRKYALSGLMLLGTALIRPTEAASVTVVLAAGLWAAGRWNDVKQWLVIAALAALATLATLYGTWHAMPARAILHGNAQAFDLKHGLGVLVRVGEHPWIWIGLGGAFWLCRLARWRPLAIAALVSFGFATLTSCRVGSNTNYFLESTLCLSVIGGLWLATFRRTRLMCGLVGLAFGLGTFFLLPRLAAWQGRFEHHAAEVALARRGGQIGQVLSLDIATLLEAQVRPLAADPNAVEQLATTGRLLDRVYLAALENGCVAVLGDAALHDRGFGVWRDTVRQLVSQKYRLAATAGNRELWLPKILAAPGVCSTYGL